MCPWIEVWQTVPTLPPGHLVCESQTVCEVPNCWWTTASVEANQPITKRLFECLLVLILEFAVLWSFYVWLAKIQ